MKLTMLLVALVALAGCTSRLVRGGTEVPPADRVVTLPSGATLKVAPGSRVTERGDGLIREVRAYLTGVQKDWKVPPDAAEVKRLAGTYRSPALGDIAVHVGPDEAVVQFGGWKSRVATRVNPDGTVSFVTIDPGVRGFEFHAPPASGTYRRLILRDAQHVYPFDAVEGG